jgi:hypothetical protein
MRFQISMAVSLNLQAVWHVSLFRWYKSFGRFESWWLESLEIEDEGITVSRKVGYDVIKDTLSYHGLLETYIISLSLFLSLSQSRCRQPNNSNSCFGVSDILQYIFVGDKQMADRMSVRPFPTSNKTKHKKRIISIIITKFGKNYSIFRTVEENIRFIFLSHCNRPIRNSILILNMV